MKTKSISILMITSIFLFILGGCINNNQGKIYFKDGQVFKGEILLKATKMNKNGIVRVYLNEGDGVDKIRRGVVYTYSKDLKNFNLYDEIYFKIKQVENLQVAEIDNNFASEYSETLISLKNFLGINLHQTHEESGSHRKQHVIRKGMESNGILEITLQEETNEGQPNPSGKKDTVHVYTSHYNVLDTTKAHYSSTIGRQNNHIMYRLTLDHPPHQ